MPQEAGALPVAWFAFWMALGALLSLGLLWWVFDQARRSDEDVRETSAHRVEH